MRTRTRPASPVSLEYLPALDGIRGVAVVAVIATHTVATIPGGFLSVDVFFALSGYLITSLLVAEWRQSDSISLASVLVTAGPAPASGPVPDAHRGGRRGGAVAADLRQPLVARRHVGDGLLRRPTGTSSPITPTTSWPRARPRPCSTPGPWPSRSSSIWCGRSWSWPCFTLRRPWRRSVGVDAAGRGAGPIDRRRLHVLFAIAVDRGAGLGGVDGGARPRPGATPPAASTPVTPGPRPSWSVPRSPSASVLWGPARSPRARAAVWGWGRRRCGGNRPVVVARPRQFVGGVPRWVLRRRAVHRRDHRLCRQPSHRPPGHGLVPRDRFATWAGSPTGCTSGTGRSSSCSRAPAPTSGAIPCSGCGWWRSSRWRTASAYLVELPIRRGHLPGWWAPLAMPVAASLAVLTTFLATVGVTDVAAASVAATTPGTWGRVGDHHDGPRAREGAHRGGLGGGHARGRARSR